MQPSEQPSQPVQGTPNAAAGDDPLESRRQAVRAAHASRRAHYTQAEQVAVSKVYEAAKHMLDTSGGGCCAKLLLGLYNGRRFPFDLTDLRLLDENLYAAARLVIDMDARRTHCEVHELLNAIYADGRSTGAELETWAYRLRHGKRAKKEHLTFDFGPQWPREGGAQ